MHAALYEPLFSLEPGRDDPVAVLAAGPIEHDGRRAVLRLRPGIRRHDGARLDAPAIVEWLERLSTPASPAGHLVLPLAGARDRLEGRDARLGARAEGPDTVLLDLVEPYPDLAALWAVPEARVAVPTKARGAIERVGTGPFAPHVRNPLQLVAFLHHRDGRPYIDHLDLRLAGSPLGLEPLARRQDQGVILDLPGPPCPASPPPHGRDEGTCECGVELYVVLAVGPIEHRGHVRALADAGIDRRRLPGRFLPEDARAAAAFFGSGRPAPPPPESALPTLELVASRSLPGGEALPKRIQLDLLRRGLRTTIERSTADRVAALRTSGQFSLLLERVPIVASGGSAGRFHALLGLAARFGAATAVPAGRLWAFAAADEPGRARITAALEAELRQALGLVPLARMGVRQSVPKGLEGVRVGSGCAVLLEEARFRRDLSTPEDEGLGTVKQDEGPAP